MINPLMAHINHLAIVVEDVQVVLGFWRDALGLPVGKVERNEGEEVDIAFLPLGEGEIELLAPINETSGVAKYLAQRARRRTDQRRAEGQCRRPQILFRTPAQYGRCLAGTL